jgi:hypothetical protein
MSDDAYTSFLDKANSDLNAGRSQQGGSTARTARTETVDTNVKVPAPLHSVDTYYISDTDEPFEPVTFKWDRASKGIWPSAGTFKILSCSVFHLPTCRALRARLSSTPLILEMDLLTRLDTDQLSSLISPSADLSGAIETLSASSFDPKNQYASALHAVRAAAVEGDSNADPSTVDIKVYRVELSSTKVEYWVLALDVSEGLLVGLRAKAVES